MSVRKTYWARFIADKIHLTIVDDGWGGYGEATRKSPALFCNKGMARKQFEDVRKVEIVEVKK